MVPLTVVEHLDVFRDREPGTGPGIECLAVIHFILQRGEERFRGRIVITNTGPPEAAQNVILLAVVGEFARGVLAAPIRVKRNSA